MKDPYFNAGSRGGCIPPQCGRRVQGAGRTLLIFGSFSHDPGSGLAEVLGVLKLEVYAKRFVELFSGFRLRTLCIGHGLLDTDDLMTFRALAEAMACVGLRWLASSISYLGPSHPTSVNSGIVMSPVSHWPIQDASPVD